MDFMREVLGFRSSDIAVLPDGTTMATWMHLGDLHHDVAMFFGTAEETLDHLAWTINSLDHMKLMLDACARAGIQTETGPGRHNVGGNLYSYFWAPGGNRYELSGEMPRASDRRAPALRWNPVETNVFSAWGAQPPESFKVGS
jgi:catechol 2,3-dioxygenase